jgi:hypothetical protein
MRVKEAGRSKRLPAIRLWPLIEFSRSYEWKSRFLIGFACSITNRISKRARDNINLNATPFIDLRGYHTAQHFDDLQKLFPSLLDTAQIVVTAHSVIDGTLKEKIER